MIKKNKTTIIFANILTLLPIVSGIVLWDKLPPSMPIHWNLAGNADSYGSKAFFVFGLPLIMLALLWVCILLTALDKESNIKALDATQEWLMNETSVFNADKYGNNHQIGRASCRERV